MYYSIVLLLPLLLVLVVLVKGNLAVQGGFELASQSGCVRGIAISLTGLATLWVWWMSR